MPPLHGFSDNPFITCEDFKKACVALLWKLKPYQSPGGARIKLPLVTGTHFDDVAAQLEGFARPLWAVGALLHGGCLTEEEKREIVEPYVRGLANGTNPNHGEYWGPVVVRDQRMVEMEIISFALLAAPDIFFQRQTKEAQNNIRTWLNTLNGKDFPVTNWLWFRVMTNLALVKVCGVPYEHVKSFMDEDLDQMEMFYLGQGWAADGTWSDHGRQADYYSGSFAIQFSQLLYAKFAADLDSTRCSTFCERAKEFSKTFWQYFDSNGAAIPFGRSLTYRFAFAGFWSAVAFAGVELPEPLNCSGTVKGLMLRHFRWWSAKHDIFNVDGTLTIGFAFPNMYLCEDYNSPQSPYWAMKSFVALGLGGSHPFWTHEEKPLPMREVPSGSTNKARLLVQTIEPPMHIVCDTAHHHFLLSAGQFCPWPLKATEAKYGKFAYSSNFAFSVPTGSSVLAQLAPDNTIALSKDSGQTWRVPWKLQSSKFGKAFLHQKSVGTVEELPTLVSSWKPWKDADVQVSTVLIAPSSEWPDWHIRVHKFRASCDLPCGIDIVQGGFAVQGRKARAGEVLPNFANVANVFALRDAPFVEGALQCSGAALVCSDAGASGVRSLEFLDQGGHRAASPVFRGEVLKPDANTNLVWQRTLIPTLASGLRNEEPMNEFVLASGIFAVKRDPLSTEDYEGLDLKSRWESMPTICDFAIEDSGGNVPDAYISLKLAQEEI